MADPGRAVGLDQLITSALVIEQGLKLGGPPCAPAIIRPAARAAERSGGRGDHLTARALRAAPPRADDPRPALGDLLSLLATLLGEEASPPPLDAAAAAARAPSDEASYEWSRTALPKLALQLLKSRCVRARARSGGCGRAGSRGFVTACGSGARARVGRARG
jgi:hypothetical protein